MTAGVLGDIAVRGCAALSRDAGEPLAGSAPAMRRVIAVEHVGMWPPRVAEHPDEAVAGLAGRLRAEGVILLLIRRPGRRGRETESERAVFVADLAPGRSRVVRTTVRGPEDLDRVSFDLSAGEPVVDPLLLVCAHGRRDVCCAVRGRALAASVVEAESSVDVWECTHLGGHRFAPTALVLPTGYAYGRLDASSAIQASKAAGLGEVEVRDCRGHVGLEPVPQVAEIAVREHTGIRDATGLVVDAVDGPGLVEVRDPQGRHWAVDVRVDTGTDARPPSCGAALEPVTPLVAGPPQLLS
ncbi:hypothetical protein EV383_1384 [Pseudonocardia sediminis]|uniref:Sucrase/ferredoxin-like protein n=1 Tax=Pseudonocardia sediminis TaxID=1397368 RepID=A0A4Q7UWR7_PSEST|nr:sucrase ferredoxin [Pseudonocardia sediminis]RZT84539.1 hypothetical protein EV383_1384 [Pseudonocardia sediminis]